MKIIVLPKSSYVVLLENSVGSCSFHVLSAVSLGAAGSCCATQNWSPILFNWLLSWPCRCDGVKESAQRHGVVEVVIDLSDSEDYTKAGERTKTAGYCQCEGAERSSRILDDGTKRQAQKVHRHVHKHDILITNLHVSLLETGSHQNK